LSATPIMTRSIVGVLTRAAPSRRAVAPSPYSASRAWMIFAAEIQGRAIHRPGQALPGNPYDGHTFATIIPEIKTPFGANLSRIMADPNHRGQNGKHPSWENRLLAAPPYATRQSRYRALTRTRVIVDKCAPPAAKSPQPLHIRVSPMAHGVERMLAPPSPVEQELSLLALFPVLLSNPPVLLPNAG